MNHLKKWCAIAAGAAALAGISALSVRSSEPATPRMTVPQYTADGALLRPKNFQTWVLTGASIGLGYSDGGNGGGPGEFHNIQMQPEAYQAYARTGKFPEKTMLIITRYEPEQKVSINRHGYFEGDLAGMEVAVKDREHFPEGWAYFDFSGVNGLHETAQAFPKETCYSCHVAHGADDNVFTQFYPILRGIKSSHPAGKYQ